MWLLNGLPSWSVMEAFDSIFKINCMQNRIELKFKNKVQNQIYQNGQCQRIGGKEWHLYQRNRRGENTGWAQQALLVHEV